MSTTQSRVRRGLVALVTATALAATPATAVAAAEVDLTARLQPTNAFQQAGGRAHYEADHGGRDFEITVTGVRSLRGKRLAVRVRRHAVGTMVVNRRGRAHLERHGTIRMRAGNAVRVRTRSGALVTHGTLRRHHGD